MKELIFNEEDLSLNEMDEVVTRVKVLLINSNNELLLGYSAGTYQFIGGHVEAEEDFVTTINREIKEEAGIELNLTCIEPFFSIKHYTKNYHNSDKNRLSIIYYFVIYSDAKINLKQVNYTDEEKTGNFVLEYVTFADIEQKLINSIPDNPVNEIIVCEMLDALREFKNSPYCKI